MAATEKIFFFCSHPWTPILRRQDGSVNCYRNWTDYKNGFGDVKGEFFIGLEKLHNITANGPPQELLLILQDFALDTYYAKYDNFKIASESEKYAITELGNYTGNAGDNLGVHKGSKFSTADNDNSGYDINCAYVFDGAWWFLSTYCYSSHLNGPYGTESTVRGIIWTNLGHENSLSYAELLIRPKL
ncbi:ficolin-1-like [Stomoxys calcitrans]|uniref:ficolin-1-like n=1 Tax=Stomoxys calcitrans TaxID=35570 RepID=UPI0027E23D6D|nr:ficolin-1-like [Stomoxys calcitrans]